MGTKDEKYTTGNTENTGTKTVIKSDNDLPIIDHIKGFNSANLDNLPDFYNMPGFMDLGDDTDGLLPFETSTDFSSTETAHIDHVVTAPIEINPSGTMEKVDEIADAVDSLENKDGKDGDFPKFHSFAEYKHFVGEEARVLPSPPFTINPITFIAYRILYNQTRAEDHLHTAYKISAYAVVLSIITSVLAIVGTFIMDHMTILHVIQLTAICNILLLFTSKSVGIYVETTVTKSMFNRHLTSQAKVKKLDVIIAELKKKKEFMNRGG